MRMKKGQGGELVAGLKLCRKCGKLILSLDRNPMCVTCMYEGQGSNKDLPEEHLSEGQKIDFGFALCGEDLMVDERLTLAG